QAKARELGIPEQQFSNEALDMLMKYAWPGNVRELENVIDRALALSRASTMSREDLPQYLDAVNSRSHPVQQCVLRGETRLSEAVYQFEQGLIRNALAQAENNQTRAAALLGTTKRILKYKTDNLGTV